MAAINMLLAFERVQVSYGKVKGTTLRNISNMFLDMSTVLVSAFDP